MQWPLSRQFILAIVLVGQGCEAHDSTSEEGKGRAEVVVKCLYRETEKYLGVENSALHVITWNNEQTIANVSVQDTNRMLATYRVEQLRNSIRVTGGIIGPDTVTTSSTEASAAEERDRQIIESCLGASG